MGAARLPAPCPLRPEPAGRDRRAGVPHRSLPELVLPAAGAARLARGRVAARRDDAIDELRARGHDVTVAEPWSLGRVSAVARDDGQLKAAANARRHAGLRRRPLIRSSPAEHAACRSLRSYAWSPCTTRRPSRPAGSRSGRKKACTRPIPTRGGETFVVMHPPPNISGSLTIGHCLQLSLEDALVRYHRMRGFNTLFQPGYDHGGISTWAAIGRELAKEGKTQRDLGREGFDEYAQRWLEQYGGKIMRQFRLLGASLDYRRERFTMDPGYYRAVMRWFVHLYERGLDLPRQPDGQLVPARPDRALRPRGRARGRRRHALVHPLPARRRLRPRHDRDRPPGDDPRRRRRRGPSRTTSATATSSARRSIVPFVERRVPVIADEEVDPRVRHRRAQGHAGTRSRRLRYRAPARPARARP